MNYETQTHHDSSSESDKKTKLRLTRRGKAFVAAGLFATGIATGIAATEGAHAIADRANEVPAMSDETYVVQQGDTLWNIAEHLDPQDDPRDTSSELASVNHTSAGDIKPGDVLHIPVNIAEHMKDAENK